MKSVSGFIRREKVVIYIYIILLYSSFIFIDIRGVILSLCSTRRFSRYYLGEKP